MCDATSQNYYPQGRRVYVLTCRGFQRADSQGIPRNSTDMNFNGRLIWNFVSNNGLIIVNGDADCCKGLFTKMTANLVSALDLILEDDLEDKLVSQCHL